MKILITGGSGFVAKYLAQELKGADVLLADIREDTKKKVIGLDITKLSAVESLLKKFKPDQIYHLAAISSPRIAGEAKIREVNIGGTENLLKAARKYAPGVRILLVSTGYVYGECLKPASEGQKLNPIGPYAKSKAEMEKLALKNYKDLDIVVVRPFNHSGQGQQLGFVLPDLAKQIKLFKQKRISKIHSLNLDNARDLLHVKDVVRGYKLLMQKGKKHEIYNISSGKAVEIRKVLQALIQKSSLKNVKIFEQKQAGGLAKSVGSNAKIKRLGWKPKHSLDDVISEFV
ncbi:MAG: GDP-mannose 4,6-dehydratase [Candidatus Berkelbacteria bacterium]|nr:GDP-mannose 4,6-dehydratase [Candidatus Berkelbacteria bacterium]